MRQKIWQCGKLLLAVCFLLSFAGCFCMTDQSNGNQIQIDETTGDYIFVSCSDGFTLTGTGHAHKKGQIVTLEDTATDHRVVVRADLSGAGKGTAVVQDLTTGKTYTILARHVTPTCNSCPKPGN